MNNLKDRYTGYALIGGCLIVLLACYMLISAITDPKPDWMTPETQIEAKP